MGWGWVRALQCCKKTTTCIDLGAAYQPVLERERETDRQTSQAPNIGLNFVLVTCHTDQNGGLPRAHIHP